MTREEAVTEANMIADNYKFGPLKRKHFITHIKEMYYAGEEGTHTENIILTLLDAADREMNNAIEEWLQIVYLRPRTFH